MKRVAMAPMLAFLLLIATTRGARAQGQMAQAVYSDLRDVIEELIRSEITSSVVARVRERSPALGFYFRQTLERLESSYWGNLNTKLSADLIVLVSDYVYWSARYTPESKHGAATKTAIDFFSCFDPARKGQRHCQQISELSPEQGRSLVDQHCRALDTPGGADNELACNLALATRAGLNQQSSMALRHVVDAVTDILLHDLPKDATNRRLRKMAQTWLGDMRLFPANFPDLFLSAQVAPNQLDLESVKAMCKDKKVLAAYFADPKNSPGWICFAVSYNGLPNALAFRVQIKLPKADKPILRYHRYWEVAERLEGLEANADGDPRPFEQRLYSMFVNATLMEYCARNMVLKPVSGRGAAPAEPSASDLPIACRDKGFEYGHPVGAEVTVTWLDLSFEATATSKDFQVEAPLGLARTVNSFRTGIERVDQMRELVPTDLRDTIFVEDKVELEPTVRSLRAFLRIGRLVSELRARWYLWPDDPDLSGATRLRSIDLGGLLALALEEAEATDDSEALAGVRPLLEGRKGLALRRILDLAFRADLRELAVEGIRVALGLEASESRRPYETFFLSLAGYLLDDADSDGVSVTRESFRAAAKDLLRTLPSEGVPTARERFRFRLLPLLSARIAFNENFRNESGRAGMRILVAADWPLAYAAFTDYVGVRVSIFDLIGPLGELALREVASWQHSSELWLDLVRPRLGLWLAVPQLSRRVILDAGVGLRLIGTEEGTGDAAGAYVKKASPEIFFGVSVAL